MWIADWTNVGKKLLQHDKHASTKISWRRNTENNFTEVSSNNDIEVTANDDDVYIYPNGIRPRLLPKLRQQIWKHLLRLTSVQYVMCHLPLKMDLLGVIIVIMF